MTAETKTLYTANVHVTGGREGRAKSSDGRLDIKLATPGAVGPGTNPEQLFAAGWSACFEGAIMIAATAQGVTLPEPAAIDAAISLQHGEGGYALAARLDVRIPGVNRAVAQQLIDIAHRTCPYSKAIRGNIDATIILA